MGRRWWAAALGSACLASACSGQIELDGGVGSGGDTSGGAASGGDTSGGVGSGGEPVLTGGAPSAGESGGTTSSGGDAAWGGAAGAAGTGGGDMVLLPGGSFLMGEDDDGSSSSPRHERTLAGFWMDRTEVTAAAYHLCVLAEVCTPADATGLGVNPGVPGYENYPANYVTLKQAEVYCAWVGKRLPTEAEWEYAAGGLQGYEYPWGDATPAGCIVGFTNPLPEHADYNHGCQIGQYPANDNGLLDVGGGVYEYTSSPYCYYDASTDTGYVPGCKSESYALRDGAFSSFAKELARVTFRQATADDFTHQAVGFRCAASP